MESINQLNDWILKQGGTLLVAGWTLALTEEMPDEMQYEEFQNKLEEKLQCEMIRLREMVEPKWKCIKKV